MSVLLGVVLAVAAVALVALPFLREPVTEDDTLHRPDERHLLLVEDRDRALAALKELEFDHRTSKVADEDYRELVGPLRQEAARALKAIERERRYGAPMTGFEIPDMPAEPGPPPDEGTIPAPAEIPEPYPPPDEATIPSIPQE